METDDPFASLGGLGSGLGGNFGPRTAPFRSQSFNVGSNSGPRKDKQQDPPVEHDLYVTLDDICKVSPLWILSQNILDLIMHISCFSTLNIKEQVKEYFLKSHHPITYHKNIDMSFLWIGSSILRWVSDLNLFTEISFQLLCKDELTTFQSFALFRCYWWDSAPFPTWGNQ